MGLTVKELIERLRQFPEDARLLYWFDSNARGEISGLVWARDLHPDPFDDYPTELVIIYSESEGPNEADGWQVLPTPSLEASASDTSSSLAESSQLPT